MKAYISIIIFCFCSLSVIAQQSGSPYSIYGVGSLTNNGVTFNTMKGGQGISSNRSYVINNINPALLPLNTFTIFDFGVSFENRQIKTDSLSETTKGGGLNYISLAVPLKSGKMAMSLGLRPYSVVKYNVNSNREVLSDTTWALYNFEGSGGLNEAYLQTGFRIGEPLFVGASLSYIFGRKTEQTSIFPASEFANNFASAYFISEKINGFKLGLSAAYLKKLKDDKFIGVGAVYELSTNLNAVRSEWLGNNPNVELSDSLEYLLDVKGDFSIPSKLGLGVSFYKEFSWSIGVDYYMQNWGDYSNFENSNEGLTKSYRWILGGEYTPDFFSVNSYWKRLTFLAGVNYTKTPLSIENEDIFDFGINFGVSLPFANGSTVNLGFTSGQLGTTKNNLIQENYYKISLGISFNDQSYGWYRKQRKFN